MAVLMIDHWNGTSSSSASFGSPMTCRPMTCPSHYWSGCHFEIEELPDLHKALARVRGVEGDGQITARRFQPFGRSTLWPCQT